MTASPIVLLHTDVPEASLDIVQRRHGDLQLHSCDSYAALPAALQQTRAEVVYSVRFDGTPAFPREALLQAEHVKWISVGGSGTDHLQPWQPQQVTVTNAAGVAADMMAEYALGCLLSFRLQLREFHVLQNEQRWQPDSVTPVAGSTALLIGLGQTGCAVARRFKALDLTVLGVRARPQSTPHVDEVHGLDALPQLLPRADVIVCAVPLLDSTRALLASDEFALTQPHAILIDVSRGGVVDETALLNALEQGRIQAAALDVFATEPLPGGHPFWGMSNVIVTPHCSSVYPDWELRSVEMFVDNLDRYRKGQRLDRVVDPARGY